MNKVSRIQSLSRFALVGPVNRLSPLWRASLGVLEIGRSVKLIACQILLIYPSLPMGEWQHSRPIWLAAIFRPSDHQRGPFISDCTVLQRYHPVNFYSGGSKLPCLQCRCVTMQYCTFETPLSLVTAFKRPDEIPA